MNLTYRMYSPLLDRWFEDSRTFRSLSDARLFLNAMYSGNWYIVEAQKGGGMTDLAAFADHIYGLPDRELMWFAEDRLKDDCPPDVRDCLIAEVGSRNLLPQLAVSLGDDPEDYE